MCWLRNSFWQYTVNSKPFDILKNIGIKYLKKKTVLIRLDKKDEVAKMKKGV